ncbi:MAG: hypothetical protein WKG01_32675 [Kofleriaceae bacterium]
MQTRTASTCATTLLLVMTAACGVDDSPALETEDQATHGRSLLFHENARPAGVSMERWSERMWKWIFRQPAETNPLLDQTGADCGVDQGGPVWFLPSIMPGGTVFVGERSCTIPRGKAILVQTATYLNDYPCPDPNFHPAPGQSLYDFLIGPAR